MRIVLLSVALLFASSSVMAANIPTLNPNHGDGVKCTFLGDQVIYKVSAGKSVCFRTPNFESELINPKENSHTYLISSPKHPENDFVLAPGNSEFTDHAFIIDSVEDFVISRWDTKIVLVDKERAIDVSFEKKSKTTVR